MEELILENFVFGLMILCVVLQCLSVQLSSLFIGIDSTKRNAHKTYFHLMVALLSKCKSGH